MEERPMQLQEVSDPDPERCQRKSNSVVSATTAD
jgi:hypothetical protein